MTNQVNFKFLICAFIFSTLTFSATANNSETSKFCTSNEINLSSNVVSNANQNDPNYLYMLIMEYGNITNPAKVTPSANFFSDLLYDDLDFIELIMAVEELYEIEITDEEAETVLTVQDLEDLILEKID
jgi:acyl carrier protein